MARPKILLVDDNQELLRLMARLIEAEGWEALPFPRGKLAIQAIAKEKPAFAIVDILLPDMLGYDVAAALRQAGVPFLFATGIFKGGRAANEARTVHGALAYFDKPFEAKKVLEVIRTVVPPEPSAQSGTPATIATQSRISAPSDFDVAVAVEPEEPVAALDLLGKVEVQEAGSIVAVITGRPLQAAAIDSSALPKGNAKIRPLRRAGPPAEGELHDNLPELINAFWLTQQTGELVVQRGKVKKAIFFEAGRPCYAISNLVADRFAPFLVRVGKLTTAQLELCRAAADRTRRRMGDILIEMGVLREAEKLYYIAQQVKAIAYSVFGWEDGQYRLHFTGRALDEHVKVEIPPMHLIARGVKKLYRPERVARLLADHELLIPTQQPTYPLHEIELEEWEAQLLVQIDGTRSVGELIALAMKPPDTVRASLWALVALEIVEKRVPQAD
jgi:CheY-like chemotaxis protein